MTCDFFHIGKTRVDCVILICLEVLLCNLMEIQLIQFVFVYVCMHLCNLKTRLNVVNLHRLKFTLFRYIVD